MSGVPVFDPRHSHCQWTKARNQSWLSGEEITQSGIKVTLRPTGAVAKKS
jgi:hypothetical protein